MGIYVISLINEIISFYIIDTTIGIVQEGILLIVLSINLITFVYILSFFLILNLNN